ncbi:Fis family transcriptional regulator [Alkalimarinus sediminis]|uniref:Fis family transcriptional regulator n=1 Tax=Alkalimarinus sediminis TaxID=1632866 RepID=A0A9E8HFD9_9ALTE|nr:Fis family transcriptional regulator [Alkalimarinus sediminis]UZW73633.1 Fis family transcriptional regulator [Alkalimarinus sediminis]
MRRTDKKIDNNVRKALTIACDTALEQVEGFKWLTHTAKYDCFPGSLLVTCVFDTDESLDNFYDQALDVYFRKLIQGSLLKVGVKFKHVQKQVRFDTEEACEREHGGNWTERIAQQSTRLH